MAKITNKINKSGTSGEEYFEYLLKETNLSYKRNASGIDFIVLDKYYIEIKNQRGEGSVNEKIPHTIYKYYQKYKQKKYFIVGTWKYNKSIMKHIKHLEDTLKTKVFFYTPTEMIEYLLNGNVKSPIEKFI